MTGDAPSSLVAHAIGFVKSQLTGEVPSMGTHKAVSDMEETENEERSASRGGSADCAAEAGG